MLKHIPGSRIGKADGLSRRSDWEKGMEGKNAPEARMGEEYTSRRSDHGRSRYLGEN